MYEKITTLPSLGNQDWTTVKVEIKKPNELLTHISTKKYHRIKRTNLCKSEMNLWENQGSPKKHEQKLKTWMGNSTGNADKKSTTTSR